jgi:hypothetical protein
MKREEFEQLVERNLSPEEAKVWLEMFDESRQHRLSVMREAQKRWQKKHPEVMRAIERKQYWKRRQDPARWQKLVEYQRAYNKQYYWKDVDKSRSRVRERYWKMKNDPIKYQKYKEHHREYMKKYSQRKKAQKVESSADQQ